MKRGKLYLIPTPISTKQSMNDILLPSYIEIVSNLEYFVSETAKVARGHLKDLPLKKKIQEIEITELNEHTQDSEINELLKPILNGNDLGLLSDAGVPTIADPGYRLVSLAQKRSIKIIPFVGPSSIVLALMASGLNGQSFSFYGYLPKEKGLKRKKIKTLERIALNTDQTQIFMETPYKNQHMLDDILDVCEKDTRLCIAMDIQGEEEYVVTKNVGEWRKEDLMLGKKPCIFLINK
jgi:16S rRNA (cytidine1402-2'-O)-methyltransferase